MFGRQFIWHLLIALFSIPYISVLFFLSFLIRVMWVIKRIPRYNQPDPNSLGFTTHQMLVYEVANVTLIILPFLFLLAIICQIKKIFINPGLWIYFIFGILLFFYFVLLSDIAVWFAD